MKIRVDRIIVISDSFPTEAQLDADWQSPPLEVGPTWNHKGSHSEGGAGDDEMVPFSPRIGGRTGGVRKTVLLFSGYITEVVGVNLMFSPYVPPGGRGCSSLPSQSTHGSCGVLREAQRGATPPDNDRFGFTIHRDVS